MTPASHDCVQVERDALALHEALAEALRRLALANRASRRDAEVTFTDLLEVLARTSRPQSAVAPRSSSDEFEPSSEPLEMIDYIVVEGADGIKRLVDR